MRAGSVLLLGLLAVFWGLNWPIMKTGVAEVPPWVFRCLASLSGGLGLLLIARLSRLPLRVPAGEWRGLMVAAVLNIAVWNVLVMYGIERMNSGRAAILAYTMPLWATLAGTVVLREHLGPRRVLALVLGLAAMALLFLADLDALGGDPLGPVLVVLAAMSWGAGTVAVKYYRFSMPVVVSTAWQQLLGAVPIAVVALAWDWRNLGEVHAPAALSVLYNMTVTGIFCYWAYFRVVTDLPVAVSTIGTLMVPVFGVFFSAWLFDETPAGADYLALLLVVASVTLVVRGARR